MLMSVKMNALDGVIRDAVCISLRIPQIKLYHSESELINCTLY